MSLSTEMLSNDDKITSFSRGKHYRMREMLLNSDTVTDCAV